MKQNVFLLHYSTVRFSPKIFTSLRLTFKGTVTLSEKIVFSDIECLVKN
jgi:hypothetical protein